GGSAAATTREEVTNSDTASKTISYGGGVSNRITGHFTFDHQHKLCGKKGNHRRTDTWTPSFWDGDLYLDQAISGLDCTRCAGWREAFAYPPDDVNALLSKYRQGTNTWTHGVSFLGISASVQWSYSNSVEEDWYGPVNPAVAAYILCGNDKAPSAASRVFAAE